MYDEFDRSFKADMADDIRTFTNTAEFSQLTWLDGVLLPCQVSHYTAEKSGRMVENFEGLHGDFTTVYFNAAPYVRKRERLPRNGEQMHINGRRYDIVSVKNELGVAKIVCTAYRQNTLRQNPFKGEDPYVYHNFA